MQDKKRSPKSAQEKQHIKVPIALTKFKPTPLVRNKSDKGPRDDKQVIIERLDEAPTSVKSTESAEKGGHQEDDQKPSALKSIRYYVMILALFSPFVTTYSRTIINFAIIDMINPEFLNKQQQAANIQQASNQSSQLSFDLDHSCPVSDQVRARLITETEHEIERAHSGQGEKYDWDTVSQGALKGAYSIGHALFQIPGSRMSEIYGSHIIMTGASLLIALCCLLAPCLAALSFYLIYADLILLGVFGSFLTPALITLFSNWLTPGEKSVVFSFYLIASRLGYALSSFMCGLLIQAEFSWRYVFFSAGWFSLVYSVVFYIGARSRPQDHPLIQLRELKYLATKNRLVKEGLTSAKASNEGLELEYVSSNNNNKNDHNEQPKSTTKKAPSAPWLAMLRNGSVWSFIITKFCVKLAGDTVQIELPTYLNKVMHFSARDNGDINALSYVMFCVGCFIVGNLSKYVMKRRPFGLSKTVIRKCFQSLASLGVSLVLLGIASSVCDDTFTRFFLILHFFFTTFGIGGEAQIPLDITERYSGTIHAIGSSLAISGAVEPTLVGFFIKGHAADKDRWRCVWIGASVISFIGGIVFLLFADATIQPFDSIEEERKDKELEGANNKAYEKDFTSKDNAQKADKS